MRSGSRLLARFGVLIALSPGLPSPSYPSPTAPHPQPLSPQRGEGSKKAERSLPDLCSKHFQALPTPRLQKKAGVTFRNHQRFAEDGWHQPKGRCPSVLPTASDPGRNRHPQRRRHLFVCKPIGNSKSATFGQAAQARCKMDRCEIDGTDRANRRPEAFLKRGDKESAENPFGIHSVPSVPLC